MINKTILRTLLLLPLVLQLEASRDGSNPRNESSLSSSPWWRFESLRFSNGIGAACWIDAQCGAEKAICYQNRCRCPLGYVASGQIDKPENNAENCVPLRCESDRECGAHFGKNVKCFEQILATNLSSTICGCAPREYTRVASDAMRCESAQCIDDAQCVAANGGDDGAYCRGASENERGNCECKMGYFRADSPIAKCEAIRCETYFECAPLDLNAYCDLASNRCVCGKDFIFDRNYATCVPRVRRSRAWIYMLTIFVAVCAVALAAASCHRRRRHLRLIRHHHNHHHLDRQCYCGSSGDDDDNRHNRCLTQLCSTSTNAVRGKYVFPAAAASITDHELSQIINDDAHVENFRAISCRSAEFDPSAPPPPYEMAIATLSARPPNTENMNADKYV